MSSHRLYVGNLSYDASSEALEACFTKYGDVAETRIVTERGSGRPRGFALVTMRTRADAEHVIAQLDGKMFEGRPLRVTVDAEAHHHGARHVWGGYGGW